MFRYGVKLAERFCEVNALPMPAVNRIEKGDWHFSVCAFFRPDVPTRALRDNGISICVEECAEASTGSSPMRRSWPGFITDRTPTGAIAHEIGHHADWTAGSARRTYWSEYSSQVRKRSKEKKLTSYCDGDHEWFAEMFRLFVTNPDLMRIVRPATFRILLERWKPVVETTWLETLGRSVPLSIIETCRKAGAT